MRPLHLYFLKLGLSRFEFSLQFLKPSLYLFPHGAHFLPSAASREVLGNEL